MSLFYVLMVFFWASFSVVFAWCPQEFWYNVHAAIFFCYGQLLKNRCDYSMCLVKYGTKLTSFCFANVMIPEYRVSTVLPLVSMDELAGESVLGFAATTGVSLGSLQANEHRFLTIFELGQGVRCKQNSSSWVKL